MRRRMTQRFDALLQSRDPAEGCPVSELSIRLLVPLSSDKRHSHTRTTSKEMPPKQQTRYTRPVPPSPYDSQPSVVDENTIRAVSPSRHGDHPPSFHSHHDEQDYSYPSQPHQGEHESYDSYRDVNLANDGYDEEGDDALDYRVGTPGYRVTDETWEEAQEEVEAGDESVEYVRAGEAEDAPAPYRPRSGFGARDYEEVEKVGDESFDGPVEWSEKDEERKVLDPEQVLLDSPVTFAGGFGAPPPVSLGCVVWGEVGRRRQH